MKQEYTVGKDMFVAFAYTLTDADNGETLFEVKADAPDVMVVGATQEIVPALQAAMEGLKAGDKFELQLPPEAAFGHRSDDNVMHLDKQIFMRDGQLVDEVKVDAMLPMMTQEGFRVLGRVLGIDDKNVTMDFNHPFAGKTVKYQGEVVMVRPATEEELHPTHGCGGCGGGCGSCDDGGCDGGGCDGCK